MRLTSIVTRVAALAALPILVFASPALASTPTAHAAVSQAATVPSGLEPCVAKAASLGSTSWTCSAAGLDVHKDRTGKVVDKRVAVTATNTGTRTLAQPADDEDTFCAHGTICNRNIDAYTEETKGNVAYGNGGGVIGSYWAYVKTLLNGRQPQWKVTVEWTSGPTLTFNVPAMTCTQEGFVNIDCGTKYLADGRTVSHLKTRHPYVTTYGNKLNNGDNYHGSFDTDFTPSGYDQFYPGPLDTASFYCPDGGVANCTYPAKK